MSNKQETLLSIRNLRKYFAQRGGLFNRNKSYLHALESVSFDIARGETLGLVGESGCGKSTLGKTLLRLYEPDSGEIIFDGKNICAASREEMRALRKRMQMVFQDPYDSLNARHTVGDIIEEPLIVHSVGTKQSRRDTVQQLLQQVGLSPDAAQRYPHEFSGGQRQRIGIARAIALQPEFIVLDEPLSALDVSVQAQIINLLLELRASMKLSLLFISHDLSVVRHISDRVAVMYLGEIVEIADAATIYSQAKHPYTQYLIASIPQPIPGTQQPAALDGEVPSPINPPSGCRFHTRCPQAKDICKTQAPKLIERDGDTTHLTACHFA
ncbi:MAG: ATP-binding cassette domain-containing protein [Spongiibacteraceae bacterium]